MCLWVNVSLFPLCILHPNIQKLATKQPSQVPYICFHIYVTNNKCKKKSTPFLMALTLRRRIKSHLLFAGIIRSSPFSPR